MAYRAYLGFGPAAYSCFAGKRYGYSRSLSDYITSCHTRDFTKILLDEEILTEEEKREERFMLGLRLCEGVRLADYPLSDRGYEYVEKLVAQRLAVYDNGVLSLTPAGMLLDTYITSDLLLYFQ